MLIFSLFLFLPLQALPAQPLPDLELERHRANELFVAGEVLQTLPLYEDLARRDPKNVVFAERHAACIIAQSAIVARDAERMALLHQAYEELLRAQKLGDNSQYLTVQLEHFKSLFANPDSLARPESVNPKADAYMRAGESAFGHGDYKNALEAYTSASAADPSSYQAVLYAGDMAFRLHDYDAASTWFGKAIEVNPNIETAYRYWGDSLMAAHQQSAARDKYVEAIVAEPYTRTPWTGLQRWAKLTNSQLQSPKIDRPTVVDGPPEIILDPALVDDDGSGRSAWVVYQIGRTAFRMNEFKNRFPNEKVYRHTLVEEAECLRKVIDEVKKRGIPTEKLDPNIRNLLILNNDHMLEAWILLHGADQGIAQDYAGYRLEHRDLLRAFVDKYDLAGVTAPEK